MVIMVATGLVQPGGAILLWLNRFSAARKCMVIVVAIGLVQLEDAWLL